MTRRPFALLPVVTAALAALLPAQERKELGRMWTFENAPLGWFQEAYDFAPTQEWLDHARLASLRLGSVQENGEVRWFCSASFVSPYGLIMTNHHCARGEVAKVQGEHDWVKDGFYAGSYDAEVKLPGVMVSQLVSMKDVTAQVREQGQEAVLAAAKEAEPERRHELIALYQGGMYQLYTFRVWDDLRYVCAPHGQIAHFGGDPDNFCYPRWGLDFTFLRAYDDGRPASTADMCFEWKTEGAGEGDLVFVTGNPGSTGRLQTMSQCEFQRDHLFPGRLAGIHKTLAQLNEDAKASPQKEKELRTEILQFENTRKAFQGYLDGLQNDRIMAIKQRAEDDLRTAVAASPELQGRYGEVWDKIAALQQQKVAALGDREQMRDIGAQEAALQKQVGEACFAVYGTSIPPDATMSLRISDGLIKPYAMNGTIAPWFTSLYGLFARYTEFGGEHPFDLPQAWVDAESRLDLKTKFNFVATCDIIGGNSGSPMIDRDQNVVGLIFDGNIEMLGNRYVFDDEVSRTVSVHPEIIIESLRKVYGAGALADELEKRTEQKVGAAPKAGERYRPADTVGR
ncbi:MAG: S46 family peptidase [Planctomycetota bacterium]